MARLLLKLKCWLRYGGHDWHVKQFLDVEPFYAHMYGNVVVSCKRCGTVTAKFAP